MNAGKKANRPSLNSWNADYIEAQYDLYRRDPDSVPEDMRAFFAGFELGLGHSGRPAASSDKASRFQSAVDDLINAYRDLGHLAARLDPFDRPRPRPVALNLEYHGLTESDLDEVVDTGSIQLPMNAPLREIIDKLERTYCGPIGVEYMHIQDSEERRWVQQTFEEHDGRILLQPAQRVHILRQLLHAETFEAFLQKRYPGEKRFSLEGAEALIPLLDHICERATELDVGEIVLGMPHRGRLNVLNNILGKTYQQIFTEFEDNWQADFADGGGDVKYHSGYSGIRQFINGRKLHLALASNPSHLEAVDPVVLGRARAKQYLRGDTERRRVVPVLLHGDAAIAGQGIVAETLNLSRLEGYTVGGTIHIVVNNMIGFTTLPEDGRSSTYCTDVAKMIDAPIFHVNGEYPEAVVAVAHFAIEYRQRFRKDVFIDMYCYRRYGHNEQDEASFTQPILAALIRKKASVLEGYAKTLLADGIIDESDTRQIRAAIDEALEKAQDAARSSPLDPTIDPGSARWQGFKGEYRHDDRSTGVPMEILAEICHAAGTVPDGFVVNRKLKGLLQARRALPETREISFADAEFLAYGSLLLEGIPVRLSGQDSRRGTFSHRHAVLRDAENAQPYIPLNHIRPKGQPGTDHPPGSPGPDNRPLQATLDVWDSPLSEQAVLGFEYGCSLVDPNQLVLWEAQFGDFSNGAQVIIDQFIASAEAKWERWSGLVLLLPHGYEGAGPEHSSARLERFLQLSCSGNIQVVYPSTAAQFFHLLRRQVHRKFRKPLIVMTPKSRLRVPSSTIDELTTGRFLEVIDDPIFTDPSPEQNGKAHGQRPRADRSGVTRVILCTGKIYFELAERRHELARTDVALIRIEQLHPFRAEMLRAILDSYPADAERVWVQEEPRNAGSFLYIADLLREQLGVSSLRYIGRAASPSPASGSKHRHAIEQEAILAQAIGRLPARDAADSGRGQTCAARA